MYPKFICDCYVCIPTITKNLLLSHLIFPDSFIFYLNVSTDVFTFLISFCIFNISIVYMIFWTREWDIFFEKFHRITYLGCYCSNFSFSVDFLSLTRNNMFSVFSLNRKTISRYK